MQHENREANADLREINNQNEVFLQEPVLLEAVYDEPRVVGEFVRPELVVHYQERENQIENPEQQIERGQGEAQNIE